MSSKHCIKSFILALTGALQASTILGKGFRPVVSRLQCGKSFLFLKYGHKIFSATPGVTFHLNIEFSSVFTAASETIINDFEVLRVLLCSWLERSVSQQIKRTKIKFESMHLVFAVFLCKMIPKHCQKYLFTIEVH